MFSTLSFSLRHSASSASFYFKEDSHCWRFKFDDLLGDFDIFPYLNYDLLGPSYSAWLHLPRLFLVFFGRLLWKIRRTPTLLEVKNYQHSLPKVTRPRTRSSLHDSNSYRFGNSLYYRLVPNFFRTILPCEAENDIITVKENQGKTTLSQIWNTATLY